MSTKHIGSSFDSFLEEEEALEEATDVAIKRVLAWQFEQAMQEQGVSKAELARRMHTSRSQVDRLLDPCQTHVKLRTMQRAAAAMGKRLQIEIVDERL